MEETIETVVDTIEVEPVEEIAEAFEGGSGNGIGILVGAVGAAVLTGVLAWKAGRRSAKDDAPASKKGVTEKFMNHFGYYKVSGDGATIEVEAEVVEEVPPSKSKK